ncbi:MAG: N-acyl-D-amino-acid deacylase family protein [Pseudomonadales bacterium]
MSHYDILVRGGTVIDGTMIPRFRADIGIKDGRVAKIGTNGKATADRVIDAGDNIVAPGYIDIHTHYDAQILWDPYCTISGWHGVTSVVLGNCGFGFAPVPPHLRERAMLMMTRNEAIGFETMKEGMEWDKYGWETMPDWFEHLKRIPLGVNATALVPLNPLYAYVMGGIDEAKERRPTADEKKEMVRLMYEALDHGACGFSYQRCGVPSVQPDWDGSPMITDMLPDAEIIEFGKALGEYGRGFIEMFDAVPSDHDTVEDFMTSLARASNRPIVRNILLANDEYPKNHRAFLDWLNESHEEGLQVFGMGFTVRSPTVLTFEDWSLWDGFPGWNKVMNGPTEQRAQLMRDESMRVQLRREMDTGRVGGLGTSGKPAEMIINDTAGYAALDQYLNRKVADIAEAEGKHIVDVILDAVLTSDFKVEFRGNAYDTSVETTMEVLNNPYVVPGISDGGAHTHFSVQGAYPTDLLEWLVREEGVLSAEKAHYGLSRLPAHMCDLGDRGIIREGAPADLVVYNPETIRRTPSWDTLDKARDLPADEWRLVQRAEGLNYTLVNGQVTFEGLECTGATPGELMLLGEQ